MVCICLQLVTLYSGTRLGLIFQILSLLALKAGSLLSACKLGSEALSPYLYASFPCHKIARFSSGDCKHDVAKACDTSH